MAGLFLYSYPWGTVSFSKEKGQGLVEYAIIIALVALIVIAVVRLLGPEVGNSFSTIASSMP